METKTITLEVPLKRDEQEITTFALRKPKSGGLRGLSLTELLQMDTSALIKLVPRISNPILTEQDVAQLVPADLVQIGMAVSDFLLPKAVRGEASPDA